MGSDMLITCKEKHLIPKLEGNVPHGEPPHWKVHAEPQKSGEGDLILFSNGAMIIAVGVIIDTDPDYVHFTPLNRVGVSNPVEPPEGRKQWKYIDGDDQKSLREMLKQWIGGDNWQ